MDELIKYLLSPAAQIGLIIGIAEVFKRVGAKPKFIPLLDLGLGLISGVFVYGLLLRQGIGIGIIMGFALGLSACGLFSGVKNVKEEIKEG